MTIKLAAQLTLPLEMVTQTIGVLAKRRAGKSYLLRRLIEQLLKAKQQVVVVDPKGDTWGLRSSADGKGPGYPVVILGGDRGDVKLEPNAGEVVAKLVVEERVSVLLDLSLFRKHEVATFMTGFLENLYRLKAREQFRTPMMLVVDEADAIAPQKPMKGEERMLGAAEDIVRRGGQRGIGCAMATQRSAVLNKNLLTQVQVLIALRTIAPQDLAALDAWIDVHGTDEERKTLMASLPALPVGDAWIWSPGWPTVDGIFQRVHVLPIETFDSGATPKPGEKRIEPKNLADVDLEALQRQMAATIEKAKSEDPRELRKQIAELKRQLTQKDAVLAEVDVHRKRIDAKRQGAVATKAETERAGRIAELKAELLKHRRALEEAVKILVKVKAIDFTVNTEEDRKALAQAVAAAVRQVTGPIEKRVTALTSTVDGVRRQAGAAEIAIKALLDEKIDLTVQVQKREPFQVATEPAAARATVARRPVAPAEVMSDALGAGERKVLIAIAQHDAGVSREQLTVLTGYKRSSRDTYLQRLGQRGLVALNDGGDLVATAVGVELLGDRFEPLPTGSALQAHWLQRLTGGEGTILAQLCGAYPDSVSRDALSEATGYKRSSRDTYIQRLQARRLVTTNGRGHVRASDELFDR